MFFLIILFLYIFWGFSWFSELGVIFFCLITKVYEVCKPLTLLKVFLRRWLAWWEKNEFALKTGTRNKNSPSAKLRNHS